MLIMILSFHYYKYLDAFQNGAQHCNNTDASFFLYLKCIEIVQKLLRYYLETLQRKDFRCLFTSPHENTQNLDMFVTT